MWNALRLTPLAGKFFQNFCGRFDAESRTNGKSSLSNPDPTRWSVWGGQTRKENVVPAIKLKAKVIEFMHLIEFQNLYMAPRP